MTEVLSYQEAREKIETGDLIFMHRAGKGLRVVFHSLINFFTGSPIYHTGVAIWVTTPGGYRRLMVADIHAQGGRRLVPLSLFSISKMEVVKVPEYADLIKMEGYMMERVGVMDYGFLDLIMVGLREFFGLPMKDTRGDVCSAYSAKIWIAGNVPLIDTLISPGRLYNDVKKIGLAPSFQIAPQK